MTAKKPKIVIIDDESLNRRAIMRLLGHQYDYIEAASAEAAEELGLAQFDLIISDLSMPGKSGIELVRELRAQGSQTPAIIITGYSDQAFTEETNRLGKAVLLHKPFDKDENNLRQQVQKALAPEPPPLKKP